MHLIGNSIFPGLPSFILGALLIAVVFLLLLSLLLQWLWNITIPQVFGLKEITYWQAFRLLIIAGLLFGGPVYFS